MNSSELKSNFQPKLRRVYMKKIILICSVVVFLLYGFQIGQAIYEDNSPPNYVYTGFIGMIFLIIGILAGKR